jgi:hypothetical protein
MYIVNSKWQRYRVSTTRSPEATKSGDSSKEVRLKKEGFPVQWKRDDKLRTFA